jgi:DnaJ domain
MMDEIYRYFEILEIKPDASHEEARKAYRNLVKRWHPDRFTENQQLQKKANDKLRKINKAYEKIIIYISNKKPLISEKPREAIYRKQHTRYAQSRKTIYRVSDVNLITLLGKSKQSNEINHYVSNLNELPDIDRYGCYYEYKNNGIGFLFNFDALTAISLFSEGYQGYKKYRGNIPGDIVFSDDRKIINKKIGKPSKSGRWEDFGDRSLKGVWGKWFFPTYSIYVQYYKDGKISMITLTKEESAKEKGGLTSII